MDSRLRGNDGTGCGNDGRGAGMMGWGGGWVNAKTQGRNEKWIPAYAGMTGGVRDMTGDSRLRGNDGRGCGI